MDDPGVIEAVLAAADLDPAAFVREIGDPEIKPRLIALTGEAVARGVFGSPAILADDEQRFGKDRIDWFESALTEGRR
jgi:2-hydroxychromene-2-carboxylate isomerase